MNAKVTCLVLSCFALAANAGLVPTAKILEGPSTRTKVIGPDGSIIDAYAPGGKIVLDNHVGPLLQSAPVVIAQPAIAEPHFYSPLELQQVVLAEPLANIAAAPLQKINDDSITVEAAPIARISEDGQRVYLHPGTPSRVETREAVPIREETEETLASTTDLPGTTEIGTSYPDLSGAYKPDNFEKLFDDGSYRQEHY